MRQTIQVPKVVEIKTVRISVPVRYDDEDIPYDFPFRSGNTFAIEVNVDSGRIHNWPKLAAEVHMKVVDGGCYYLYDESGDLVASLQGEYVPHGLIPGKWGDYLVLDIGADGIIKNWPKHPNLDAFFPENEE